MTDAAKIESLIDEAQLLLNGPRDLQEMTDEAELMQICMRKLVDAVLAD